MSRVAKSPIKLPAGVSVKQVSQQLVVEGPKGRLEMALHALVSLMQEDDIVTVKPHEDSREAWMQAGTLRALVYNMVVGVSEGFQRKLQLVGVGYRAQAKGNALALSVGYSHPVELDLPQGVSVETPSVTEIILSGSDKQVLGQFAAKVRSYRPPEPYKGKGIRYADEQVKRKEAKKK